MTAGRTAVPTADRGALDRGEPGAGSPRPAGAGALAPFLALLSAAILVDLGAFHALEHGDSIVPVLVSLQRWTPFYWDQERYGMLVPLLALPVRDPLLNLLVQRGLLVLAGLASVVLVARHTVPGPAGRTGGTLAAAALLAAAPAPWLFEWLGNQPYALSIALGLAGLGLADPGPRRRAARLAGALALVLAAHWVNAAVGVVLLLVVAARAAGDLVLREPRRAVLERVATAAALVGLGLAAGQGWLRLYPAVTGNTLRLPLGPLAPAEWPRAWALLLSNAWASAGAWRLAVALAALSGVALLSPPSLRPRLRRALVRAGMLVLAALAYALFAATLRWVEDNAFHWRYFAPSAVLVHVAAISLLAEGLASLRRLAAPAAPAAPAATVALALALLPAAALAAYGPPSLERVRADLDRVAGRYTEDVLRARCAAIAGDYWTVWPAVWHAAVVARERGLDARVVGISHRSNPTLPLFRALPPEARRICVVAGEERHAARWLRDYRIEAVEAERVGALRVLVPPP